MKKEVRKQKALEAIDEYVDTLIFSVSEEGNEEIRYFMTKRDLFVSNVYKALIWGKAGQHFKFLGAEWIDKAINEQIEKSCKCWGVNL
jgi:hypothetical protein